MTKEEKIVTNIARFLGRKRAQSIVCRDRIERKLALKRISHARADTPRTLNSKANVKCDPGEIVSNSAD